MQHALLTTKLYFPVACPSLVPRARLVNRLQGGLGRLLTLISAPAGFGKTTLMSEWRAVVGAGYPVAWISLDLGDNDPRRFFHYMIASLDGLLPGLYQQILPLLQSSEALNLEAILTPVVNATAELTMYSMLVFDDYHVIENAQIHAGITFLLEHLPPRLHLVLLTRSDPPFPLARLRARGQLTEIRAEHLRFTVQECAQFLREVMSLELSSEHIAALEQRTEGWIAGLQLAALSMQGRQDIDGFIRAFSGSHQYIVDYLAEEVLNRQPDMVRDFLFKTSILDHLTGSLCDALTGRIDGQETLQMLAHANLFLAPVDDGQAWFRYHRLFADLLQNRFKTNQPTQLIEMHRRAAGWFDRNQMVVEAIEHYFAAEEYDEVRHLMRKYFPGWMRTENWHRIIRWFRQFPGNFLQAEPWLCVVYAWMIWREGKVTETETYLDFAEQALTRLDAAGLVPSGDIEYEALPAEILAFRALIAAQKDGDAQRVVELANRALATAPEKAPTVRAIAHLALHVVYRNTGEIDKAIQASMAGLPEARAGQETGTVVSLTQSLGTILIIQGRLRQAVEVYREALAYSESKGEAGYPAYGLIRMRLADIYYQWNQLDEAESLLKEGLERVDLAQNPWGMIYGRYLLCMIQNARGDHEEVQNTFRQIEELLPKTAGAYYAWELNILLALVKTKLGLQVNLAIAPIMALPELGEQLAMPQFERWLLQMRVEVAENRLEHVSRILPALEAIASQQGNLLWLVEVLVLQTVAWQKQGHREKAISCLEKALILAETEGLFRVFLDEGRSIEELLRAVKSSDEKVNRFIQKIMKAFVLQTSPALPEIKKLSSPLSGRELELLGLIAAGRSNKEIARELVIAIGTVKRHTVNIFNKLDVKNRTEAVAKARQLGMLKGDR